MAAPNPGGGDLGGSGAHPGGEGDGGGERGGATAADAEYCGSSNPPAVDHSLFPAAARSLAAVWKDRPTDSHRWTSGLGGVE
jgi:hypothetical protein